MSGYYTPPGYFVPSAAPLVPVVSVAHGIGLGAGIGRDAIGSGRPIPSLFNLPEHLPPGAQPTALTPFVEALRQLRTDRLMRLGARIGNIADLSDDYLVRTLLATERLVERELRIFITPRQIVPVGTPAAEVAALAAMGCPMVEEPGYPFDTRLFNGMDLEVRHRPIIDIYRLWYSYQGDGTPAGQAAASLYDVPLDWIQMDRKYGRLNMLPQSSFTNLPLNTWLLSVLGSGRDIPFGLKLRYSAGLRDARNEYPDLVNLILRRTVISIMDDSFIPQSGSISADGLSQSLSTDVDKYRDAVEKALNVISSSLKGVRMTVL
jgi:hypothetical protein